MLALINQRIRYWPKLRFPNDMNSTYLQFCCHRQHQRHKFHYHGQQQLHQRNEFHGCQSNGNKENTTIQYMYVLKPWPIFSKQWGLFPSLTFPWNQRWHLVLPVEPIVRVARIREWIIAAKIVTSFSILYKKGEKRQER